MSQIIAQRPQCQGYANCMVEAPDHFDLDEQDKVVILDDSPTDADMPLVRAAVNSCPAKVLQLMEERP